MKYAANKSYLNKDPEDCYQTDGGTGMMDSVYSVHSDIEMMESTIF